jgi:hypothetical protein
MSQHSPRNLPHLLAAVHASQGFAWRGHTMALQDLFHMPHQGLMAEPEMQLERCVWPVSWAGAVTTGQRPIPHQPHLLL